MIISRSHLRNCPQDDVCSKPDAGIEGDYKDAKRTIQKLSPTMAASPARRVSAAISLARERHGLCAAFAACRSAEDDEHNLLSEIEGASLV